MAYNKLLYQAKIYRAWADMKKRCNNPMATHYEHYGGRGITYCKKWEKFEGFLSDMEQGHDNELWLDRIDNQSGYSKKNCRWATKIEQANNKRNNRYIRFKGKSMTISRWAEKIGIKRSTLSQRYYVYKWSIKKCLTYNKI